MLEEPTSGEIIVDGENLTDGGCDINKVRQKMGMVFQSFNLFNILSLHIFLKACIKKRYFKYITFTEYG